MTLPDLVQEVKKVAKKFKLNSWEVVHEYASWRPEGFKIYLSDAPFYYCSWSKSFPTIDEVWSDLMDRIADYEEEGVDIRGCQKIL